MAEDRTFAPFASHSHLSCSQPDLRVVKQKQGRG